MTTTSNDLGARRIHDPDGAVVEVFPLPRDESSLRSLLEDIFVNHWHEIVFGPILEGAAWELTAAAPPSAISCRDGYLTIAFHRLHFHLCIGPTRGSRRNPTPAELAKRRQTARAELFRRLGPSDAPVSWGLRLFNGAMEPQLTVFLPNPLLSSEGRSQEPDWSRLALWDALRARWTGAAGPEPADRSATRFFHG